MPAQIFDDHSNVASRHVEQLTPRIEKLNFHQGAAYDRSMLVFIYLGALIGGLLMYMFGTKNPKVEKIGLILLASSILAGLIAIAPAAIQKLLH